jgi:hypothetical protein
MSGTGQSRLDCAYSRDVRFTSDRVGARPGQLGALGCASAATRDGGDRVESARDPNSVSRTLASGGQCRRLVKKAQVVDLLDKKIGHIRARDESGAPVVRID